MKNLKVGVKIALGFGVVCLLMIAIVLSVFVSGTNTTSNVTKIDAMSDYLASVNEVKGTFYNVRIYANILLNQNSDSAYQSFVTNSKAATEAINNLVALSKSDPMFASSVDNISAFASTYSAWIQNIENVKKNYSEIDALDGSIDYDIQNVMDSMVSMLSNTHLTSEQLSSIALASIDVQTMMTEAEHVLSGGLVEHAPEVSSIYNEVIDALSQATAVDNGSMIESLNTFDDSFTSYVDLLNSNTSKASDSISVGNQAVSYLDTVLADADSYMMSVIEYTKATSEYATILVSVISGISILLSIAVALYLANKITNPIKRVREVLVQVASTGNLHVSDDANRLLSLEAKATNEIGECAHAMLDLIDTLNTVNDNLNKIASGDISMNIKLLSENDSMGIAMRTMMDSLNHTFSEVNGISREVAENAKGVSESSLSLAQGATEQTAAVAALGNSIAKVAEKTLESAQMATDAAKLGDTIKHNAEVGTHQMEQMMDAVKQINEASNSISKVISVIDNIAFQTNILALNAAVEAARAGQHGKGFAVVAEEVRNLASKSADAAKDTGSLIANSMEKAALGAKIAEATSASLADIVSGINENSRIVKIIAESSENQTNAINEINRGISQVGEVVHLISKGAELSSGASYAMKEESSALSSFISSYRLKDDNGKSSQFMLTE